eukprot:m.278037 g.278037  ORF g.278037 m.278037 type:complete len:113 (+) comp15735_c0_seq8:84-422(+)
MIVICCCYELSQSSADAFFISSTTSQPYRCRTVSSLLIYFQLMCFFVQRFRVQPMARVLGVNVFQQLEEGNSILRYHEGQVHRHCFQHTKEELDALVAKCCTLMDSHSDVGL